jgi:hypothetical protein
VECSQVSEILDELLVVVEVEQSDPPSLTNKVSGEGLPHSGLVNKLSAYNLRISTRPTYTTTGDYGNRLR